MLCVFPLNLRLFSVSILDFDIDLSQKSFLVLLVSQLDLSLLLLLLFKEGLLEIVFVDTVSLDLFSFGLFDTI